MVYLLNIDLKSFLRHIFFISFTCFFLGTNAQETALVKGVVTDSDGIPIEAASVSIVGSSKGEITDDRGQFELEIPSNQDVVIGVSHISYVLYTQSVNLVPGETFIMDTKMQSSSRELKPITVKDQTDDATTMEKINPKVLNSVPNPSGSIENGFEDLTQCCIFQ